MNHSMGVYSNYANSIIFLVYAEAFNKVTENLEKGRKEKKKKKIKFHSSHSHNDSTSAYTTP